MDVKQHLVYRQSWRHKTSKSCTAKIPEDLYISKMHHHRTDTDAYVCQYDSFGSLKVLWRYVWLTQNKQQACSFSDLNTTIGLISDGYVNIFVW